MNTKVYTKVEIKVADELFVAVALLQREHPEQEAFSVQEILKKAKEENLAGNLRPGLKIHAYSHAVANLPAHGGRYRILFKTASGKLRLLRAGDDVHPDRNQKIWPDPEDLPERYRHLVAWAKKQYSQHSSQRSRWLEGIFQMRGLGKKLWAGQDADAYVDQLRREW